MLTKFWDSIGTALANRWAATGGPALVFYAAGLLAWVATSPQPLPDLEAALSQRTLIVQLACLVGALIVVLASAVLVERLVTPTLRLLEGYWPRWADAIRRALCRRIGRAAERDVAEWQQLRGRLAQADLGTETEEDLADLARLERRMHYRPADSRRFLPTRTGNILRSGEDRPVAKYGLDAVVVWPRLWLMLPDTARQELAAARRSLDSAVQTVIWGVLFIGFTMVTWWAIPLGLCAASAAARWWIPVRAEVFADLLDAAYDLHRLDLYRQLHWPLPKTPAQELAVGARLTAYLWRGGDEQLRFTRP